MKVLLIILSLIFQFAQAETGDEDYHVFLIPLNQCKSLSVDMFKSSTINDETQMVSTLICIQNIHFLSCKDSYNNKINFNLVQNVEDNQYVFINNFGNKLLLDAAASVSVLNQSFISGKSAFVSETCKGLFFKDLIPKRALSLNNGLNQILKKMDGVVYEK